MAIVKILIASFFMVCVSSSDTGIKFDSSVIEDPLFDFTVVEYFLDESALNSGGLRRKLKSQGTLFLPKYSKGDKKEDDRVLKSTGLRRRLQSDPEKDEKEDEDVLKATGLRRKLQSNTTNVKLGNLRGSHGRGYTNPKLPKVFS